MTPEEDLLRPRYKVIADYPQPPFNDDDEHKFIEGDLLWQCNVNGALTFKRYGRLGHMSVGVPCIAHPEKFPKIFQSLQWWEDRKVEDYPAFLKTKNGEVRKINQIVTEESDDPFYTTEEDELGWYFHQDGVIPATEQEYLEYIKQKEEQR